MIDMKHRGLPRPRSLNLGEVLLLLAIVFATSYYLLHDEPARKVVDVRVTMTANEYAQALDRARKQGEDDMRKRVRACNLGDTFTLELPIRKGPM